MIQSTALFFLDFIEYNVYTIEKINKEASLKRLSGWRDGSEATHKWALGTEGRIL